MMPQALGKTLNYNDREVRYHIDSLEETDQ